MITVIVVIAIIPKFHRVELFLMICLTLLGIPYDVKRRVNPNIKTIGMPIAINNSIKKKASHLNLDQRPTIAL